MDQDSAKAVDADFGIVVGGEWDGQWCVRVKDGTCNTTEAGNLDDVQAILPFTHPSDFVLTSFQRFPGGEATSNQRVIEQTRHRFFRI